MKRSPLPFTWGCRRIKDSTGETLFQGCDLSGRECSESHADAEFIVRACNSHEKLVEALYGLLEEHEVFIAQMIHSGFKFSEGDYNVTNKAKQALEEEK